MATTARDAPILNATAVAPVTQETNPIHAANIIRRAAARLRESRTPLISLLVGLLGWEIAGRLLAFAFLPPFSTVLQTTWRMTVSGEIPRNLSITLAGLVIGYAAAVAIAVPLGLLMGRYKTAEYLFDPYLNAMLATPSFIYVPILFSLFGVSRLTQIAVVFLYAFSIITVNAIGGIRAVEPSQVEMARSFGASEQQIFRHILLPGALPMIMAGLRLGMGRAVRGMINGEMLVVVVGMGALLRKYGGRFDAASVFGILIVIIAIALVCFAFVDTVDRRLNRWTETQR